MYDKEATSALAQYIMITVTAIGEGHRTHDNKTSETPIKQPERTDAEISRNEQVHMPRNN